MHRFGWKEEKGWDYVHSAEGGDQGIVSITGRAESEAEETEG